MYQKVDNMVKKLVVVNLPNSSGHPAPLPILSQGIFLLRIYILMPKNKVAYKTDKYEAWSVVVCTRLYSDLHGSLVGGGLEPVPPRGATSQHFRSQSTLKTSADLDHVHVHFTKLLIHSPYPHAPNRQPKQKLIPTDTKDYKGCLSTWTWNLRIHFRYLGEVRLLTTSCCITELERWG